MSASALIAAVRKERPLWDPADLRHHNRLVVSQLWRQVGQELGLSMMVAKSKWRGLRDYYRQQLKRAMEQPDSQVTTSWAHFQEMAFLGPSLCSAAKSSVKDEPPPSPEVEVSEALEQKWSPPWSMRTYQESELSEPDDEDLYFFKSLIPDLKRVSRQKKAFIKLKIQELVYREVYGGQDLPEGPDDKQEEGTIND